MSYDLKFSLLQADSFPQVGRLGWPEVHRSSGSGSVWNPQDLKRMTKRTLSCVEVLRKRYEWLSWWAASFARVWGSA